MQPNITHTVPFFIVGDMEESLKFYVEGLGFSISHKWEPRGKIEWCNLRRDTASLMLQEPFYKEHAEQGKKGVGVSVVFICKDALALYHEFIGKSLTVSEPFVGNNMWVISLRDPDGFHVFFESDTEVPEETIFSDWIKNQ